MLTQSHTVKIGLQIHKKRVQMHARQKHRNRFRLESPVKLQIKILHLMGAAGLEKYKKENITFLTS